MKNATAGRLFQWLLGCALTLVSLHARADDRDLWQSRPNAVELHMGAGTPVGYIGVVYDRLLWGPLSASAGLGVGSERDDSGSLQLAAGAKVRVLQTLHDALYLSLEYSTGAWRRFGSAIGGLFPDHSSGDEDNVVYSERAHWLNALIGGEFRSESGFVFRIYAGMGTMLNPGSRRCIEQASRQRCQLAEEEDADPSIFIAGLAFGAAMATAAQSRLVHHLGRGRGNAGCARGQRLMDDRHAGVGSVAGLRAAKSTCRRARGPRDRASGRPRASLGARAER